MPSVAGISRWSCPQQGWGTGVAEEIAKRDSSGGVVATF